MVGKFICLLGLSLALHAGEAPVRKVLFICTGNYFRSAFAECYFNFLEARDRQRPPLDPLRKKGPWRSESRGLDLGQLSPSQRATRMSIYAIARLKQLKVPLAADPATQLPLHAPTALALLDLKSCDRVIAIHEPSHRPMIRRFLEQQALPAKEATALMDRVVFWNIQDVVSSPAIPLTARQQADRALDQIQTEVDRLFSSLD